jgi:cobalt-zinc-cadmium efflux system membrane fusion protein
VQPEQSLFEVHDPGKARILGFVSERDSASIRTGQTVRVRLTGRPAAILQGTVAGSSRSLGKDDRTMLIWVDLQSVPPEPLLQGMFASLTLDTGPAQTTLAVPHAAIVREGSRSFVFVRDPSGIFERRSVRTGRSDDVFVELLAGVAAGDVVAVTAAQALQTAYAALR